MRCARGRSRALSTPDATGPLDRTIPMIDDTGGDRRSSDAEDDAPFLPTPDELAELEAVDLAGHAVAVLAELKERGMLRVLLRNRVDLATLFEADEVRFAD